MIGNAAVTGGVPGCGSTARVRLGPSVRSRCGAGRRVGELAARTGRVEEAAAEQRRPVLERTGPPDVQRADGIPLGRDTTATTSLASSVEPSWKVTPSRSVQVQTVRSSLAVHSVASDGHTFSARRPRSRTATP